MIYSYLIVGVLVLFGALGFWWGWLRSVAVLAGVLVIWMVLASVGEALIGLTNRLYLIVAFIIRDGFDARQPGAVIETLRRNPAVDPSHPDFFLGVIYVVLTVLVFLAASRHVAAAASWSAQALGALVGLADGYVLTYLAFHYFAPAVRVRLPALMSTTDVGDVLGRYLPTLLVAGVILAIGIALLSSRRLSGKGNPRPAAGRTKG